MNTYTVIQMEQNSWREDADGQRRPIEKWDCGHKHRTLKGALACLDTLSGTTRSIGANAYANGPAGPELPDLAERCAAAEALRPDYANYNAWSK